MRTGEMLRDAITGRGKAAGLITSIFILLLVSNTNALPLQYLPDIAGYIPVYIRYGDQPLEEINPALAEAFKNVHEIRMDEPVSHNTRKAKDDVLLDLKEENTLLENSKPTVRSKQLIYILPQDKNDFLQNPKPSENKSVMLKVFKSSPTEKLNIRRI